MKAIKSYQQFLNESKSTGLIYTILDALEPTILSMVNEVEAWFVKKFERPFSDFDREMTKLQVIADLVKSIEYYTEPTDKLLSITPSTSRKGNIEISAQIQRGTETYGLSTEAIVAGGYNIQRAHYRYITSTKLPRTGRSEISKEYSDKIKRMSKAEKLNAEIKQYEARVTMAREDLAINSKLTDNEIIQTLKDKNDWYEWPTWSEIIKRDAAKNYNNDEAYYNQNMIDSIAKKIESWKNINIAWKEKSIVDLTKEITKLQNKLEVITASI